MSPTELMFRQAKQQDRQAQANGLIVATRRAEADDATREAPAAVVAIEAGRRRG